MNTVHLIIAVVINNAEQGWQNMFRVSGNARANTKMFSIKDITWDS